MTLRWTSLLPTLLLASLVAVGCGETTAHYSTVDDSTRIGGGNNDDSGDNQSGQSAYRLEAIGSTNLESNVGDAVDLGVRLVNTNSESVANQRISFEIVNGTNDDAQRLEASAMFVDAEGVTSNRLRVGSTVGSVTVRAAHQWVNNPIEFNVDIQTAPVGSMRVFASHDRQDLFALSNLEVRFWQSSMVQCSMVPSYVDPIDIPLGEGTLPTIDDTHTFEGLTTLNEYTVALRGHGPEGQIAAKGCVEGVQLEADGLVDVTVPMNLLELSPTGEYDVVSYWDFSEALAQSGPVGSAIMTFLNWVYDPAGMLTDTVVDLAVDYACDNFSSEICLLAMGAGAAFSGDIEDFLNDQIQSIGFLAEIQNIGQDLMNTVANMKVESILTIDNKVVGEGELRGTDSWLAMYFYWTRNCGPADPPECGEIRIGLGQNSDFGVLDAHWDGSLFDYNQLDIEEHAMTIPYGQVIMLVLSEFILPALTGGNANTLGGAVEYWLCENINDFSAFGITIPMESICYTAAGLIGLAGGVYISSLEYDINLSISGIGTVIDYTSDGIVDAIEDGLFTGTISGDNGTTEMHADFTAERRP